MKKLGLLIITAAVVFGCKKQDSSGIPLVPVDIYLYANNPVMIDVSVPGGWEYITGGSRGIIIYRYTPDQFVAFDRHSPYMPENGCKTMVDSTNIQVSDPCSESMWLIVDGSVLNGPAGLPLKQYQTTFDGNQLHIFN